MAKLVNWGKEQDSTCICGAPAETTAHVMLQCKTLSNPITAAHGTVFASIRHALQDVDPAFEQHWCAKAGDLFPDLASAHPALHPHFTRAPVANLERQTPDAIFVHSDGKLILLIELARTDYVETDYNAAPLKKRNTARSVSPFMLQLELRCDRPPL